ncbi:MAG: AAA family ATPase [Candidatus Micrarchaeota archaeon]|nr:AAA family ATPase [Candidatus Micrarchaeota archaeon]
MPEGIFRNEAALSPEYLPEQLPGRESEVSAIASALRPACEGRRPRNLFVFGGPGTGKTSSARFVLTELAEAAGKAVPVYVNCWREGTAVAVLSRISQALGLPLPRRGLGGEELMMRVMEEARADKRVLVVFMDEVDSLSPGEDKVLYDLSRAGELFGAVVGVVCIANNRGFLAALDARVRSSFAGTEVEFRQYSPLQLKEILRTRAGKAFFAGACPEEVIGLCAAHGAKMGGDARVAIETLWFAGRVAEKNGRRKITVADAREAIESGTRKGAETAAFTALEQKIEALSDGERLVVDILRKKGALTSGELYADYRRRRQESERTIRNYVDKLEAKRLVLVEEVDSSEGRTRKITLAR